MQLNPARGRKLALMHERNPIPVCGGFMQLNPARGRKHRCESRQSRLNYLKVYAAQPREGTETVLADDSNLDVPAVVYAAQPREGTET